MNGESATSRAGWAGAAVFALAAMAAGGAAAADAEMNAPAFSKVWVYEMSGPNGRRILLKSDGTWRYVDTRKGDKPPARADGAEAKDAQKPKEEPGEATLTLERKTPKGGGCSFALQLVNTFPYEIGNLVLYYSAYRANGVVYDTQPASAAFSFIKPGDRQQRDVQFVGLTCDEIVRVQVSGGDRCVMGELDKFSYEKGKCLARVRVVPSDLVRFDK